MAVTEKPKAKPDETVALIKAVDNFIDAVGPNNSRLAPTLDGWMEDLRAARRAVK